MSSKYTAFRCPEELLEKAKLAAKRDRRSLSNYLITLIDKDVTSITLKNGERHEDASSEKDAMN